jgi:ribosome-binding protein aMBF1 (putative translation factor)
MGHYCRICGRQQPNEQFSGKGHTIHVCKRCKAMPKSERQAIENMDDIFRFMRGTPPSWRGRGKYSIKVSKFGHPYFCQQ